MNDFLIINLRVLIVILAVCIFIIGGLVIAVKFKQSAKRTNRTRLFRKIAQELNFKFLGAIPYGDFSDAPNFKILTSGEASKRFFVNAMAGAVGDYGVSIFDFIYYVPNPNWQRKGSKISSAYFQHHQTVVMLESAQINLPLH